MPRSAYTSPRQLYRLLHNRRPADDRWSDQQQPVWDEIVAASDDHERAHRLLIDITDSESDWHWMAQQRLLLAVGKICMANDRPDIWRQIYEAWDEMPAPDGETVLLDELTAQARRGEI